MNLVIKDFDFGISNQVSQSYRGLLQSSKRRHDTAWAANSKGADQNVIMH